MTPASDSTAKTMKGNNMTPQTKLNGFNRATQRLEVFEIMVMALGILIKKSFKKF